MNVDPHSLKTLIVIVTNVDPRSSQYLNFTEIKLIIVPAASSFSSTASGSASSLATSFASTSSSDFLDLLTSQH